MCMMYINNAYWIIFEKFLTLLHMLPRYIILPRNSNWFMHIFMIPDIVCNARVLNLKVRNAVIQSLFFFFLEDFWNIWNENFIRCSISCHGFVDMSFCGKKAIYVVICNIGKCMYKINIYAQNGFTNTNCCNLCWWNF